MKPKLMLLSGVSVFLLAGCAGSRQFVPMPDQTQLISDSAKGRIYVMRTSVYGAARTFAVAEGGRAIGRLGPKGYLSWERQPGETMLSSTVEDVSRLPLSVEPGETYFIHLKLRSGMVSVNTKLELVDNAEGEKLLKACKPAKVQLDKAAPAPAGRSLEGEQEDRN